MAVTRKTVTVLFADVADSTALGERLDPETLRGALGRWFDAAREAIERHGGTVEKFVGDAVMAVFGVPQLHEDDALRAVRAADDLRRQLAELNAQLERERGMRLEIRIGVNTGEVVAGDDSASTTLVTGDAVNVAKRLEEGAAAGEVLVGEGTHSLARDGARFEPVDPMTARGKAQPLRAWRLVSVDVGGDPSQRRFDTPLVGRQSEWDHLRQAYERAVSERTCYLFTLLGPAGIGKSRLASELFAAVADKATILVGRCLPYGNGITFWPLTEILRELEGEESVVELFDDVDEGELVYERLCGVTGRATVNSQETFWAVRKLCEGLARRRPLILCFEDVHWAEPTFLDLIEYLAGWIRDVPILLVCIARPEFLEDRPAWLSGQETAASLTLRPLTAAESEELLGQLGATGAVRARIVDASEGNPLYVEQMAAAVAEADGDGLFTMPPTIQALLAARLDRLTPAERGAIERASICGKEFWREEVAELTPDGERDRLGSVLLSLVRKELIRPHRSTARPDDAFRFAHALIRDAAYAGMPKASRALQHETFADWLETTRAEYAGEIEEITAYHLEQASRLLAELGGDDDRARALAVRAAELLAGAGRRALARSDMPAAANLLGRAVDLEPERARAEPLLLRELSSALWATGQLELAQRTQKEALDAALSVGDRRVEWYVRLDRSVRRNLTNPDASEELQSVAREAVAVFEELGDELGLARAWRGLARVARGRCRFAEAQEAAERALEHTEATGDPVEAAGIVDLLCTALLYGPAPAEEAAARCAQIAGASVGNPFLAANANSSRAGLEAMCGRFDEARLLAANAASTYEELGHRMWRAGLSQIAGRIELSANRLDDAERELRLGLEILGEAGQTALIGYSALLLAETLLLQGREREAREYAEIGTAAVSPDDTEDQVVARTVAARLKAADGEFIAAESDARAAVRIADRTDALVLHADALGFLGEVLLLAEQRAEARTVFARALDLHKRKSNVVGARRVSQLVAQLDAVGTTAS